MSLEGIATRYAQALYEIGVEQGNLPALTDEIRRFSAVYSGSPELRAVLDNPLIEEGPRMAVLDEVASKLGAGPVARNTIKLLAQRKRLAIMPYITRSLERATDERSGVVRASVTTAAQLSEPFYTRLKEELEKSTGKRVQLDRSVDPELLGGVVTRIGDQVIDGSLRTKLAKMKTTLTGA